VEVGAEASRCQHLNDSECVTSAAICSVGLRTHLRAGTVAASAGRVVSSRDIQCTIHGLGDRYAVIICVLGTVPALNSLHVT